MCRMLGWIYETFAINSDKHPHFLMGYQDGMLYGGGRIEMQHIIYELESRRIVTPTYKVNAECQLRGWKKAYHERYGSIVE